MRNILFTICFMIVPVVSFAKDFKLGDLIVDHPVARETTATAMSSAGYFTITNNGPEADTLLAVEANFPRVMIHDTTIEDGVATMTHLLGGVVIPAGESITFEPSGKHVMIMGLGGDPFELGEEIPATLQFEKAGALDILFLVEEITATRNH